MTDKIAFVLAAVQGAAMLVNRFDYDNEGLGPGAELLKDGNRDLQLTNLVCRLAQERRQARGDGVVILDGGANIGAYTIPWARFLMGWGSVLAFEPQEWPFYALCGNLALNNLFNVKAFRLALSHSNRYVGVPAKNPVEPCNFGGVHLFELSNVREGEAVQAIAIDALNLQRLDILKLDIEGMELEALAGAANTIDRLKPLIIAEHFICGAEKIFEALPDYGGISVGADLLCVHKSERNPELFAAMDRHAEKLNMERYQDDAKRIRI